MEKLIIAGREFNSRLFWEQENSIPMKSWNSPFWHPVRKW